VDIKKYSDVKLNRLMGIFKEHFYKETESRELKARGMDGERDTSQFLTLEELSRKHRVSTLAI
jgi:hypothetical protein